MTNAAPEASGLRAAWPDCWRDKVFRVQVFVTLLALPAVLRVLAGFLLDVEDRVGVRLSDPLLASFAARDCTWFVFALIYLALVVSLAILAFRPRALLVGVQAYVLMLASRICAMYFTPLDPPAGAIPLRDPIVERLGTGRLLTRDLFFSGHTATLFLLFLSVPDRRYKPLLLACTACVAIGLLLQHVHYTVDVLVAPLFAFASYRAVSAVHRRFGG